MLLLDSCGCWWRADDSGCAHGLASLSCLSGAGIWPSLELLCILSLHKPLDERRNSGTYCVLSNSHDVREAPSAFWPSRAVGLDDLRPRHADILSRSDVESGTALGLSSTVLVTITVIVVKPSGVRSIRIIPFLAHLRATKVQAG